MSDRKMQDVEPVFTEELQEFAVIIAERGRDKPNSAIERKNPMLAAMVLEMRARSVPMRKIKAETGVDFAAQIRLERAHAEPMEKWRKRAAEAMAHTSDLARNVLNEKLHMLLDDEESLRSTRVSEIAVAMGVSTDKTMALSGIPSMTIEHKKGASLDDARKMIEAAKQKVAERLRGDAIEATVIEGPSAGAYFARGAD